MADDDLERRAKRIPDPGRTRSKTRAQSLRRDQVPPKDPDVAARALLAESDARKDHDPATGAERDPGVVRRTSDEATPPPDVD